MTLSHIEHVVREFFYGTRRSLKSHLAPVIIMSVALFILGLFFVGTANMQEVIRLAHAKVGLTAYLAGGTTSEERSRLRETIQSMPGVLAVDYVSNDEALQRFQRQLGGRSYLLEGVQGNPLPAALEVEVYDDFKTADRMSALAAAIGGGNGVDSVIYGEDWIGQLERWIYFFVAVDLFLGLVLGLSTLLVVGNTMKLALESRKDTIQVLRLVGATRFQIRLPYLFEGAILGLLASGLAWLCLYQTWQFAVARLAGVLFLGTSGVLLFFLLGGALGATGSMISLHKYLKVSRA